MTSALEGFRKLLGEQRVRVDRETLAQVETATFPTHHSVPALIEPESTSEVSECMRIANEFRVPIYPISAGRNWGYGSRVPASDGCVVMSLHRMNRIIELDAKLAYAVIEPGVTFDQMHRHLEEHANQLSISVTGGPADASVIGNVVERGIGKGPYGDRFANVCGLEVVLPRGEIIHTGFGRFPGAVSTTTSRWGVGPYFDGMFTQSNLGIVTRMSVWLTPKSPHAQSFIYNLDDREKLIEVVDRLRILRLEGTLRTTFLIGNDIRRLSFGRQYPWAEAQGRTPLPPEVREKMRRGRWGGDGALYSATRDQLRADQKRVRELLEDVVEQLTFFDDKELERMAKGTLTPMVDAMQKIHNLAMGEPLPRTSAVGYWRKKDPPPDDLNLDRDRCGVLWFSPSIPFEGTHAARVLEMCDELATAHGFEPNIGLNCVTERSIDVTGALLWDRDIPGEDERALRCHDELVQSLAQAGYFPYRLNLHSMHSLPEPTDDYAKFMAAIKRAIDPNNVLAPGRYD